MGEMIEVTSLEMPGLEVYAKLTQAQLRNKKSRSWESSLGKAPR